MSRPEKDPNSTLDILDAIDELLERDGANADEALLLEYFDELDKRAPIGEDFDPAASYAAFDERYGHLRPEDFKSPAPPVKRRRWLRPMIAVAALACILTLSVTASIYEWSVFDGIVSWVGQVFKTGDESGNMVLNIPTEDGFLSLKTALAQYELEHIVPSWIPTKYSLKDISITPLEFFTEFLAVYEADDDTQLFVFVTVLTNDMHTLVEMVPKTDDTVEYSNVEYAIVDNNLNLNIFWGTEKYECILSGSITRHEAIKIIESIG